jgi:starch synthase
MADAEPWNPETDPLIPFNYKASDFQNKRLNKERLLQAFELPEDLKVPAVGMVCGLEAEYGLDLLEEAGEHLLTELPVRVVILGTGESRYETFLRRLQERHRDRLGLDTAYSDPMAHLIHAGSDLLLVLHREGPPPVDLARAFRYGSVPIILDTGGVEGRVKDFEPVSGRGNGFVVRRYEAGVLFETVARAAAVFEKQRTFKKLVSNIMRLP